MTDETAQLSEREREILEHLASGSTNQQIAHELGISINTVKVHVRNIFSKTGVASRTEATLYALRTGLVGAQVAPKVAEVEAVEASKSALKPAADAQPNTALPAVSAPAAPVETDPEPDERTAAILEPEAESVTATVASPASAGGSAAIGQPLQIGIGVLALLLIGGLGFFLFGDGAQGSSEPTAVSTVDRPAPADAEAGVTSEAAVDATPLPFNPNQPEFNWNIWAPLVVPTSAAAATALQSAVYLIGGETPDGLSETVWRYQPDTNSWQSVAVIPEPVHSAQVAELSGQLYIPGGVMPDGTVSDQLAIFDPIPGNWTAAAELPGPRSGYGLVALEGQLYLFGGWDGEDYRDEVLLYDPDSDSWTTIASMPEPRAYGAAVVNEGKIYIIGGENADGPLTRNAVFVITPDGGIWEEDIALLPGPRQHFGAQALANFIVLLGGDTESAPVAYDLRTNTWQTFEPPAGMIGKDPAVVQRGSSLFVISSDAEQTQSNLFELRLIYTIVIPPSN